MQNQSLRLSQQQQQRMTLAPQMRQSLKLLQVPIMELRTLLQQELEQNPTLEEKPQETETIEIEPSTNDVDDSKELDFETEFETLARLDDEWRDYFFQDDAAVSYSSDDENRRKYIFDSLSVKASLQEHLLSQLSLSDLPEDDHTMGEYIIGSIDDQGYLTEPLESLVTTAGFEMADAQRVLQFIQDFDPIGVGSIDLSECLMLQLRRLGQADGLAGEIVANHLDLLGERRHTDIAKRLHADIEEVHAAATLISHLEPHPGRRYSAEDSPYIQPEVFVQKIDGVYEVTLNDDNMPHLRVSNHYRKLMRNDTTSSEVRSYIQERVRSSAFMIKCIQQRQQTIFRTATEIVKAQTPFLDHGISELRPLTMSQVADAVGVHETTVSRAVSAKYMQTPRGVFEMKYFFNSGVTTSDGSSVSNRTVKDMISHMVARESPDKPLSDQAIQERLNEDGVDIARRTIAKYRKALNIPPSHQRKTR